MRDIIECVAGWARDRNLIEGSDARAQYLKFAEEGYEWIEGIAESNRTAFVDGVGDQMVVLTIMLVQEGLDPYATFRRGFQFNTPSSNSFSSILRFDIHLCVANVMMAQGRIAADVARGRDITDSAVLFLAELNKLCQKLDVNPHECFMYAWNEICERKGQMIDGVFVKQEDIDAGRAAPGIDYDAAYLRMTKPRDAVGSDVLQRCVKFPHMEDEDHCEALMASLHKDRFPMDQFRISVTKYPHRKFMKVTATDIKFAGGSK